MDITEILKRLVLTEGLLLLFIFTFGATTVDNSKAQNVFIALVYIVGVLLLATLVAMTWVF